MGDGRKAGLAGTYQVASVQQFAYLAGRPLRLPSFLPRALITAVHVWDFCKARGFFHITALDRPSDWVWLAFLRWFAAEHYNERAAKSRQL